LTLLFPISFYSPTVRGASFIFNDGFDDDGYNPWTGTNATPELVGDPVYDGSYSSSNDGNGDYAVQTFDAMDHLFIKFWVQTNTLPPANGYVTYFKMTAGPDLCLLQLRRTSGGALYHRIRYYEPSENTLDNATDYLVDDWFSVQIEFLDDASGYYKVWIDDSLTLEVNVDTSGSNGGSGMFFGRILSGFDPTIFIDRVTLDDVFITSQGGESEYFYVDNDSSDEDSSPDVGTHSSFSSQQSAPDQINDTLTEGGSGGTYPIIEDYTEQWDTVGGTTLTFTKPDNVKVGELLLILAINDDTSDSAFNSGGSSNFTWIGTDYGDTNADSHVGIYYKIADGTEGLEEEITSLGNDQWGGWYARISGVDTDNPIDAIGAETSQGSASMNALSVNTNSDYCLAISFMAFDGGDGFPYTVTTNDWVEVDDGQSGTNANHDCSGVWGMKNIESEGATGNSLMTSVLWDGMTTGQIAIKAGASDFALDLEEQWTGLEYGWDNEELCIYGGTWTTTVPLMVDAWDGDSWENVISDLQENQWNNVSVSTYLTEATFTIRFYNGSTNAIQDSWSKDSCLLHLWNGSEAVAYIVDFSQAVSFVGDLDTDADYMIEFGQVGTFVFDLDTLLAMQLALSQTVSFSGDLDTDVGYTNVFSQGVSPTFDYDTDTDYGIELVQSVSSSFSVDLVHTLRTVIGYIADFSVGLTSVFDFDLLAGFGIDLSQSITGVFDFVTGWGANIDLSQGIASGFNLDIKGGFLANLVQGISSSFGLATQTDYLIELVQSLTTGFNIDLVHTLRTIIGYIADFSVSVTSVFGYSTLANYFVVFSQGISGGFGLDLLSRFTVVLSQSIASGFDYVTSWGTTVLLSQAVSFASSFSTQAGYLANLVQTISSSMGITTQTDYLIELVQTMTTSFSADVFLTLRTIINFVVDLSVGVAGSFSLDTLTNYNIVLVQAITSVFNFDLLSRFTVLLSQSITSTFDLATSWGSNVILSQGISFASSLSNQAGFLVSLVQGITGSFGLATQTDYLIELSQSLTTGFNVDIIKGLRAIIGYFVDLSVSVTSVFGYSTLANYGIILSQTITSIFNLDTLAGFGIGLSQSITSGFDYVTSWGSNILLSQAIVLGTSISLQAGFLVSLVQGITGSFGVSTQANYFVTLIQSVSSSFNLDILFVARDAIAYFVSMSVSFVSGFGFDTVAGFGVDLSQSISSVFSFVTGWGANIDLSQTITSIFNFDTLAGYNIVLVQGITGSFGVDLLSRFTVLLSQSITSSFSFVTGWASNIIILSLPISFVSGIATQANYFATLIQSVSSGFNLDLIAGFGVGLTQVITTGFSYVTNWTSSIDLSQGLSLVSGIATQTNYGIELVVGIVTSFSLNAIESFTAYFAVLSQAVTVSLGVTISSVWTVLPSLDLLFSWVTDVFQMRLQLFPTPFSLGYSDEAIGYIIIACLVTAVVVACIFFFKDEEQK